MQAGPPPDFHKRPESDRFVPGTKPVLIQRARIWTGLRNGSETFIGDILLEKGLIKAVGHIPQDFVAAFGDDLVVVDARELWVTPGIVDIHSHIGDDSAPALEGSEDVNSLQSPAQPWLRSLDGLNTHDFSYPLSIAGGVTTSLILPGSANAIGGQAFVIKLRRTAEGTPTSMLLEPPFILNDTIPQQGGYFRWRHMKHACGENPSRVYKVTRMDTNWVLREAYNIAARIKESQDEYCSLAALGKWDSLGEFPGDLQWEALVDVLRGNVKVNAHCYEAVDLDALVRLSNEFKFPIAAFHHASEAYLVPDLVKKAYGSTPAIALFATNSRYKREAYRSSEFAPRILAQKGLTVLLKSDHPVLNSRYLLYEAQQAYYYGLPENLAIASVTSNAADVMGMGHRIGYIREGWDADLVIWDSHPLALGASPIQVFIDGIPHLNDVSVIKKPDTFQRTPLVPNFDQEANAAVRYEGLPPLVPNSTTASLIVFLNIKSIHIRGLEAVETTFSSSDITSFGVAVVQNGSLICAGAPNSCLIAMGDSDNAHFVDLEGGSISPGLVSFGSPLGLQHIEEEGSTNDGDVYDPIVQDDPAILDNDSIIRAVDGLMFGSRNALLAFRNGVTSGVAAPDHAKFYSGLGVSFSLNANHKLEDGAIIKDVTGVHVSLRHFSKPSVSAQMAALRRLLLGPSNGASGHWFAKVTKGEIPLIVEAHSADIIANLIIMKYNVEAETGIPMKLTITGGTEAHILAEELSTANVGVILNPPRPFPFAWEDRRILAGPPISKQSSVSKLISHGVTVGLGCDEAWAARNLPFEIAWVAIEAGSSISKAEAMSMGSVNVDRLLGSEIKSEDADLVARRGGDLFDSKSKVIAVISPRRQVVHIL